MIQECSIEVMLSEFLVMDTVKLIIEKGSRMGFIYHKSTSAGIDLDAPVLNSKQAIDALFRGAEDRKYCLVIEYEGTYFLLNLMSTILVNLKFTHLSPNWVKKYYNDSEDLDFGRYISVILDLLADVKIFELKAINGNFNQEAFSNW